MDDDTTPADKPRDTPTNASSGSGPLGRAGSHVRRATLPGLMALVVLLGFPAASAASADSGPVVESQELVLLPVDAALEVDENLTTPSDDEGHVYVRITVTTDLGGWCNGLVDKDCTYCAYTGDGDDVCQGDTFYERRQCGVWVGNGCVVG